MDTIAPVHLDLEKHRGLTIHWSDGRQSFYPIAHLRRMSPSADMVDLRAQLAANPLTVLPQRLADAGNSITATDAQLVGNYALKIVFSDGHQSGIFSWDYLRRIDPNAGP